MEKTIIIAEIGECYNGDLGIAKRLIFEAKNAGCDIAKFQTLDYENIADDDPEREWFQKIAMTPEKISILMGYGKDIGIEILFTPENLKTAIWLKECGLNAVKIASSTLNNHELLFYAKNNFRKIFVSTGMASLDEVNNVVSIFEGVNDFYLMHCISEYPTGPLLESRGLCALDVRDVRLNMMKMLIYLYPSIKIGYSDHTSGILAPVAAVAMGAKVVEKHITLDRSTPIKNFLSKKEYLGTDHVLSIEPHELRDMVKQIREVEKMFGKWVWERSEGEKILKNFLRERFCGEK